MADVHNDKHINQLVVTFSTETRMMFIKHYAPNRCLCIKVANSIDHWVEDCRDVTKTGGRGDMYKEWKLL